MSYKMTFRCASTSSLESTTDKSINKVLIPKDDPLLENLRFKGKRLQWTSDLDTLKSLFSDGFGFKGKWSSPGGNSKRFKCENFDIVITWYYKKQMTLLFQGGEGSIFKDDLINAVEDREATKEEVICDNKRNHNETPTDQHVDSSALRNQCDCPCREYTAELEGVKLNIVILQKQLEGLRTSKMSNKPINVDNDKQNLKQELMDTKIHCLNLERDLSIIVKERNLEVQESKESIISLEQKVKSVEEERDSLKLALEIIESERNIIILSAQEEKQRSSTTTENWDLPKRPYKEKKIFVDKENVNPSIDNNRFEILNKQQCCETDGDNQWQSKSTNTESVRVQSQDCQNNRISYVNSSERKTTQGEIPRQSTSERKRKQETNQKRVNDNKVPLPKASQHRAQPQDWMNRLPLIDLPMAIDNNTLTHTPYPRFAPKNETGNANNRQFFRSRIKQKAEWLNYLEFVRLTLAS